MCLIKVLSHVHHSCCDGHTGCGEKEDVCTHKKLGKSVGRCSRRSIAHQVVKDQRIKDRVVELLGDKIRSEMKAMCSLSKASILRSTSPDVLQSFKWGDVLSEMEKQAPIMLALLRKCVQRSKKVSVLCQDPKRKTYRANNDTVVGVCAAYY